MPTIQCHTQVLFQTQEKVPVANDTLKMMICILYGLINREIFLGIFPISQSRREIVT
jgi:hypothetical protein